MDFVLAVSSASRPPRREALVFVVAVMDSGAEGSMEDNATIDHSDIRGSVPQGHDSSGAASD